jgi:hypothetical protein
MKVPDNSVLRLTSSLIVLVLCISCNDKSKENHKNIIPARKNLLLTAKLDASFSDVRNYYYLIDLRLKNKTKSTCEFYTLSCGSLINILTDSKDVSFLYHNCPSNIGILVRLKPDQEYSIPIILLRPCYHQVHDFDVKFGFIINKPRTKLLSKNEFPGDQEIFNELKQMRTKQENVIWSEPIVLTTTNYCPYEIRNILNDSTYTVTRYH